MLTLRVRRNDQDFLWTEPYPVAWLSWTLISRPHEDHHASISVSGAIEVNSGEYDMLDWLIDEPLSIDDKIELLLETSPGSTPFVARRTAAEQEKLRQWVLSAESSGELDAARMGPHPQRRESCSMVLTSGSKSPILARTNAAIHAVTSSGIRSSEFKSDQWRIRIATIPSKDVPEAGSTYFWSPISNPVYVALGA